MTWDIDEDATFGIKNAALIDFLLKFPIQLNAPYTLTLKG